MIDRRYSKKVFVGDVAIGGDAPIVIQSMLNTKTNDVIGCLSQIKELKDAGCDLIRITVPNEECIDSLSQIVKRFKEPLIADIHYSYRLAHLALDAGVKKIRMNPGNMPNFNEIESLALHLNDLNVPVRVGVNGGSLNPKYNGMSEVNALVESCLEAANYFEKYNMKNLVLAIKSSDVQTLVEANELLAKSCDYPIHVGVTESGTLKSGLIKSAIGIGTLLQKGIGDTIRVSLSSNVVDEVYAAKKILQNLKLRNDLVEVISCPTCGRTEIDVEQLANKIEDLTKNVTKPLKISVLGCPLNGIGEGKNSDIGIAGGKDKSVLLYKGEIYKTVSNKVLFDEFIKLLEENI